MTDYTPTFTAADLATEVRRLAEESPDFVYMPIDRVPEGDEAEPDLWYGGCSYVNGSEGKGCIVGQALANLGVPVEVLRNHEGNNAAGVMQNLGLTPMPEGMRYKPESDYTPEERFCTLVQRGQDQEEPWGTALRHADEQMTQVEVTA